MKKLKILLASLLAAVCLCSCGGQAPAQTGGSAPPDAVSDETESHPPLSLITNSRGIFVPVFASEDNAFYDVRVYTDATADVVKYDLDTMQIERFTAEPIPDVLGGAFITVAGERVLVFKTGHVPFFNYEGESSMVYILNRSGEIETTVTLPEQQLFKTNSAVAYDGQETIYLFLETYEVGAASSAWVRDELCAIHLDTGEIVPIQSFSTTPERIITGIYAGNLMITSILDMYSTVATSRLAHALFPLYGPSAGLFDADAEDHTFDFLQDAYCHVSDIDGSFYYINRDDSALRHCDLSTGEVTTVIEDLNVLDNPDYSPYLVGFYDNHLMVYLGNNLHGAEFFIDLETGKIVDSSLPADGGDAPRYPIADSPLLLGIDIGPHYNMVYEGDEYFIVQTGLREIAATRYIDGKACPFNELVAEYRAIPKEKLWACSTEYIDFTDLVHDVQ